MARPSFAIFAQQYFDAILQDFGQVFLNEPIPRDPNLRVFKIPSRSDWGNDLLRAVTAIRHQKQNPMMTRTSAVCLFSPPSIADISQVTALNLLG